ncbi:class I SAM-dependent methyltransferase [Rhodovulum sp. DZ06]|uniref:class I SAM-dependent methyltransferase n=1 Tax=Rhodovulum sp. DZ06 TaxID=3425126 RepID=UPI003D35983C
MDPVRRHYETYPYPERDPADEAKRLIEGSPSDPREIDHFLFRGRRDWSKPFRALVAGGGTGDGLIQLAARLAAAKVPADITYVDMSEASRAVAEARAAARGLTIRFETGDLVARAPELAAEGGPFDYIDCCGVLHHLPEPQAGFDALSAALSDEGGMGLMVYAPYGRTGVYPLQEAFQSLLADDAPEQKVARAKATLKSLPQTNWFLRNEHLSDHEQGDAGLYDLLLHDRDRPYTIEELCASLGAAGLGLVSVLEPVRYDPLQYLPDDPVLAERVKAMAPAARLGLGERLAGNIRTHVVYAARTARAGKAMAPLSPEARPRLRGVAPRALAVEAQKKGRLRIAFSGHRHALPLDKSLAPILARLDGRPLGAIAREGGMDWLLFAQKFGPAWRALTSANLLHCSERLP